MVHKQTLRVGVGGPVGSGKTALLAVLCNKLREQYEIAVVTNDIYTKEDANFLIKNCENLVHAQVDLLDGRVFFAVRLLREGVEVPNLKPTKLN